MKKSRLLVMAMVSSLAFFVSDGGTTSSNAAHSPAQQSSDAAAIAKLINECVERTTSMMGRIFDYSYTHTSTFRKRDKHGNIESEDVKTFEAYPVRGRKFVYILVGKNGEPVSAERVERDRRRAVRELAKFEERERELDNRNGQQPLAQDTRLFGIWYDRGGSSGKKFALIPTDFLGTHEFYAPRRARFNDREALVFSFRPRTGAVETDTSGRLRARLGGRVWVDAVDKVLMRLEAVPLNEVNDSHDSVAPNTNTPFVFELTRLPNGTWVPALSSLNTYGRESVFEEIKFDFNYRCSDFKLFTTNVDRVEIKPNEN